MLTGPKLADNAQWRNECSNLPLVYSLIAAAQSLMAPPDG